MLIPRQPVPSLSVETVAHGRFDLTVNVPKKFTMLVCYRGLHCPICAKYLVELERLVADFEERGIQVLALSSDNKERAETMANKIKTSRLLLGYGLRLADARKWGLSISASRGKTSIGIEEPPLFSEPGVFLIRPDGTLYYGSVQTMLFARPNFTDLLGAIDFAIANAYPARGEYIGPLRISEPD